MRRIVTCIGHLTGCIGKIKGLDTLLDGDSVSFSENTENSLEVILNWVVFSQLPVLLAQ
jgi:hypothetical protein